MSRAIRLEDAPALPAKELRFDTIRVHVGVVKTNSTGGGGCYPKSFDDEACVVEKLEDVANGMPGEWIGFHLQVHLERSGFTVWAQGEPDEAFRSVAERAARIWVATKAAFDREHAKIIP